MNFALMNNETKNLSEITPTKFVKAYCSFWMQAFLIFRRHLPSSHVRMEPDEDLGERELISIEAVSAFGRCFNGSYQPKVKVYD